jgi:uncharacterized protein YjbJ (UPF0337 family)
MDKDQIKGKVQSSFGKAEQAVGEAVGSQDLSNAGVEDQVKGNAKETWGNVKDTANSVKETIKTNAAVHEDHAHASASEHATNLREKIAAGSERAKNAINDKLDDIKDNQSEKRDNIRRTA